MPGLLSPQPEIVVKRGDKSFGYILFVCGILISLFIGILSFLPFDWLPKLVVMISGSILIFCLCFFNSWTRNKIVGILSKSQEKLEKHG